VFALFLSRLSIPEVDRILDKLRSSHGAALRRLH
jgi:hypothetical protein